MARTLVKRVLKDVESLVQAVTALSEGKGDVYSVSTADFDLKKSTALFLYEETMRNAEVPLGIWEHLLATSEYDLALTVFYRELDENIDGEFYSRDESINTFNRMLAEQERKLGTCASNFRLRQKISNE